MDGKQELMVDFDNPREISGLAHELIERLMVLTQERPPGRHARLNARQMAGLARTAAASPDYILAGAVFEVLLEHGFEDRDGRMEAFFERVETSREIPCRVMEGLYWTFLDHHDLGAATARAFARKGNYDFMNSEWAQASSVGLDDIDDEGLAECLEAVVLDAHSYFVHGHADAVGLLSTYCRAAPRIYPDTAELWSWFALDVCDSLDQYDMGYRAPLTEVVLGWPLPEEGPKREEVRVMLRNADTHNLLDVDGYELWWLESWGGEG